MNKQLLFQMAFLCLAASSCKKSVTENQLGTSTIENPNKTMATVITDGSVSVNSYVNTSSYVSTGFTFLSPQNVDKNRIAIGGNSYTEVYGFNVPEENRVRGIRWNTDDETTAAWRPQGIAGFSKNGVRYLLISWYGRNASESKGSRVTLMDISPSSSTYLTYRHILLVQNSLPTAAVDYTQYTTYAPLMIHAGGMAVHNDKLYIASSSLGLRIFDLNKIVEVTTGSSTENKCGKASDGKLYAFNYRYILPQVGYQKINNAGPYSTVQINYEKNELWTGQYYAGSSASSIVPKIYGFPINSAGVVQSTGIKTVTPKNSLFTSNHAHGIQGVFRKGNKTWLSCTGSPSLSYGSTARLARYTDGADDTVRFRWPYGAEALYYEESLGYLWSLTEFEPNAGANNGSQVNRCIFAVDFSKYE